MSKVRPSLVQIFLSAETYFGLSLSNMKYLPDGSIRVKPSTRGILVSITLVLLLSYCIIISYQLLHQTTAIEKIFQNNLQNILGPVLFLKQSMMKLIPFVPLWIHYFKCQRLHRLLLINLPARLGGLGIHILKNNWRTDGAILLLMLSYVAQNVGIFQTIHLASEMIDKEHKLPEPRWEQNVTYQPFIHRLVIGQILLRLNMVQKGFKALKEALEHYRRMNKMAAKDVA